MDLAGSLIRSMVCCHVGRPATTFLSAVVTAALAAVVAGMMNRGDRGDT